MIQAAQGNINKSANPGSFAIEAFKLNTTTWRRWLQRLQGAFVIFSIKDQTKVLLHYVGPAAFDVLCDRLHPFDRSIYATVRDFSAKVRGILYIRTAGDFKLHQRKQLESASVQQYVALHKLSIHCKVGTYLKTALRN